MCTASYTYSLSTGIQLLFVCFFFQSRHPHAPLMTLTTASLVALICRRCTYRHISNERQHRGRRATCIFSGSDFGKRTFLLLEQANLSVPLCRTMRVCMLLCLYLQGKTIIHTFIWISLGFRRSNSREDFSVRSWEPKSLCSLNFCISVAVP